MKIGLLGYYGFGNLGDDLLLQVLKEKLSNADISIISRRNLAETKNIDVLILGGGGLLQDRTSSRSLWYYLSVIFYAKLKKKKVVLLAQGIGPVDFWLNRYLIKIILNKVDLITVRDDNSAECIKNLGISKPPVHITADLVFSLDIGAYEKSFTNEIGISVRRPKDIKESLMTKVRSEIAEIIKNLIKQSKKVSLFALSADDITECRKIADLSGSNIDIVLPENVLNKMKKIDVLFGMRLHSLILACLAGKPCIGISYDPKVKDYMSGINMPYVDINNIDALLMTNYYNDLVIRHDDVRKKIENSVALLKNRAELNFEILNNFLYPLPEFKVLGIKINNVSMDDAKRISSGFIGSKKPRIIFTPNPEIIMSAQNDKDLMNTLNSADLCIPDGAGLVWACRNILKIKVKERVTGIDLMNKILEQANIKGYKIFLLGGKPGTAQLAAKNMIVKFPKLDTVGTHHGYFEDGQEKNLINQIKELNPDVLFVGMGQGRQERWILQNYKYLDIPLSMAIGGSFDVWAGFAKRAPKIIQKMQIEWVYRTIKEPWRLRRIKVLPVFLWKVWKSRRNQISQ